MLLVARAMLLTTLAMVLGVSVVGCGTAGPADGSSIGNTPVTVELTEKNGAITPDDGHLVMMQKGQNVQLVVTSDADDEIHVHSIPEHEFAVKAGAESGELPLFAIDAPGRFVVESHGLGVTLVTLQVG